ncbi:MAG: hypothetical protein NVSMB65_21430 [Chloroflexota bacterium]
MQRALESGAHIRVGLEDALHLPDRRLSSSNAALVAWAVVAAGKHGHGPATPAQAAAIIGCSPPL